jgi:VanZ family protein
MKELLLKLPSNMLSFITIALILYLTLMPQPFTGQDVHWFKNADKVVHVLMMLCLYVSLAIDCIKHRRQPIRLSSVYIVVIFVSVSAFGGAIEILQDLMDLGRSGDLYDFGADIVGAGIGTLISYQYSMRLAGWLYR